MRSRRPLYASQRLEVSPLRDRTPGRQNATMPVSHSRSFAFIHVRKTAGTSIVRSLERIDPQLSLNEKGLWDLLCVHPQRRALCQKLRDFYLIGSMENYPQWHLPATVVRDLVGRDRWERYFTFAFIRNPWDLVVSAYHFEQQYLARPDVARSETDRVEALRRSYDFDRFVRIYPLLEPADMSAMIVDENERCIVNYIGRFENLDSDYSEICARIGIPKPTLSHENQSMGRHDYRSYYSDETREIVARYFARDIRNFNYEF